MHRDGVELTFRQVSGLRPFVAAEVDGHAVSLMVHSNAGFRAMVTHDVAARTGLWLAPVERADYGIEEVGKLGSRGRTTATASLRVGNDVADGVEIAVFDVPQDEPVDGMLGVGWLRERGAVVDLGRGRLHFDGPPAAGTSLVWDEDWQAYVVVSTAAGQPVRFVVSTVAGVVVDTVAADRLGLGLGPVVDSDGGPTGSVVDVRPVEGSWTVDLDGRPRPVPGAVSWDLYAYANRPRPSGAIDGFLGCELLVQEGAVVDFSSGTLRLRP
ncbi:hypothetical protein [Nocardioides mesophilus]|uniref:Uncharacterized protein n=1 Tax=Nocardioides mesophilus TaxID=433659 RepID=A0A7G9RG90_9ACTN|nr:hypothetical protein [Nocardioides mesophilus]QNN54615.1 hypothetical protein H9L09_10090 [Nocardioides mesophilus]